MKIPTYNKALVTDRKAGIIAAPTLRDTDTDIPKKEYWPNLTRGNASIRAGRSISK